MKIIIHLMYNFIVFFITCSLLSFPLHAGNISADMISFDNYSGYLLLLLILCILCINIVICLIWYFLFQKKTHLYMASLGGIWIIHTLILCPQYNPFSTETIKTCILICMTITPPLIYVILQHVYRIFLRELNMIVYTFCLFLVSTILILQISGSLHHLQIVSCVSIMFSAILVTGYCIYALHLLKPDKKIFIMAIYILVPFLFITRDMIYYLFFPGEFTVAVFFMFLPLMLGLHFFAWHSIFEKKVTKKVLYVRDITVYPNGTGMVASQHCHLMETVIEYIRDNYTCPLTREDLADIVEISPDYLGRMFQKYTGKKIKEYINEYRITVSARLISETSHSFIHIAYEVGFECVATFNRYFQKVYGMAPRVYRQKMSSMVSCAMTEAERGSCHPGV
ncbi:MAG: helix-turn-helix transcriptional regulator [Spirochaetota bacterium]